MTGPNEAQPCGGISLSLPIRFPECPVQTLAGAWGKGRLAMLASLFGKFTAVFSQVFQVPPIALAPDANAEMEADEHARPQRQGTLHGLREQPGDVVAMWREVRHCLHKLRFYPVGRLNH
jgi:hypothetical protein